MALSPSQDRQNAIEAIAQVVRHIVEQASADPELRRRLVADPRAVLTERGLSVPAGLTIAVEDAGEVDAAALIRRTSADHLILPLLPLQDSVLTDADLDAIVGGVDFRTTALCYAIGPLAAARVLYAGDGGASAAPATDSPSGF